MREPPAGGSMTRMASPTVSPPPPPSAAGIAGFVISVVGWAFCGLLCPVGLIVSFFGLGREPRGLAIAGLVVGALGSLWLVVAGVIAVTLFGALGFGVFAVAKSAGGLVEALEMGADADEIRTAVFGRVPPPMLPFSLHGLGLGVETLTDPWGTQYRYRPAADMASFHLRSAGPDTMFGTSDDVVWFVTRRDVVLDELR